MNINLVEYTANTAKLIISDENNSISLYYSYNTLMAIKNIDNTYYISENVENGNGKLSQTTARYLNKFETNKDNRIKREIFEKLANKIINQISFNTKNLLEEVL